MRPELYEPYRALHNHGVEVSQDREPPMNAGGKSETIPHHTLKNMIAFYGAKEYNYWTGVEVSVPEGDIDVLLWGLSDRLTWACEVETSPTEETIKDKQRKYVDQIPAIDDIKVFNVNEAPMDMVKAYEWIGGHFK